MASLCLNMIVKNESHIIEETLENICQNFKLDYWVISDTGSTDNTVEIILNFFKNKKIAGEIHQHQWKDFAHNRNLALNACMGKTDYVLFFDADDLVEGTLVMPELGQYDAYHFNFTNEQYALRYTRRLIIKNHQKYFWKGALHELIDSKEPMNEAIIPGDYLMISRRKGSRNLDPNKALNDAIVLEKAYAEEEDHTYLPRYAFYCAQSYRAHATKDPQYIDKAIEWYKLRITLQNPWGDVDDEKYIAFENLGLLHHQKNQFNDALFYWQQGTLLDPLRAECWYHLANHHRWQGNLQLAYCFAQQGATLDIPQGSRIFINTEIYHYACWLEVCISAWKQKKVDEAYYAFKRLMPNLPAKFFHLVENVIPDFVPLIWEDTYQNVMQLKAQFVRLEQSNYIDQLLATPSVDQHLGQ